jgi:alkyl hydroperoxide reductase subunit AhpF
LNKKEKIIINPEFSTSVKDIFGGGDLTNCFGKRMIIISPDGKKAAPSSRNIF